MSNILSLCTSLFFSPMSNILFLSTSHRCLLFSHKGVLNSVMSLLLGFGSVNSVVLEPVVNQVIMILMKLAVREGEIER